MLDILVTYALTVDDVVDDSPDDVTACVTKISGIFMKLSLSIKRILSQFELVFTVMERQCGL